MRKFNRKFWNFQEENQIKRNGNFRYVLIIFSRLGIAHKVVLRHWKFSEILTGIFGLIMSALDVGALFL